MSDIRIVLVFGRGLGTDGTNRGNISSERCSTRSSSRIGSTVWSTSRHLAPTSRPTLGSNQDHVLITFPVRVAHSPSCASLPVLPSLFLLPAPGAHRREQLRSMTCLSGGPEKATPTLYCSCRCLGTWLPPLAAARAAHGLPGSNMGGRCTEAISLATWSASPSSRCSTSSWTHSAARPVPAGTHGFAVRQTTSPDARGPNYR